MRNLPELLDRIDGHEFSALVNVASDIKSFRHAVNAQPEFQELLEQLKITSSANAVRDHAVKLALSPANPMYEHPYDAAVATYLLALGMWNEDRARDVAAVVAKSRLWWWADRVIDDLFTVNRAE